MLNKIIIEGFHDKNGKPQPGILNPP